MTLSTWDLFFCWLQAQWRVCDCGGRVTILVEVLGTRVNLIKYLIHFSFAPFPSTPLSRLYKTVTAHQLMDPEMKGCVTFLCVRSMDLGGSIVTPSKYN